MVKDRSRPFSRKHRSTWLFVTGGMLLIGTINVVIGLLLWPGDPEPNEPIQIDVPGMPGRPDADAGAATAPPVQDAAVQK